MQLCMGPHSLTRATTIIALTVTSVCTHLTSQPTLGGNTPRPPGKLVDVGGHRLHVNCIGRGSPTVVLESGAGDFSFDWSLVQRPLAPVTRVCAYDRAGYAWSDPGPFPRTLRQIAFELHEALHNGDVQGPYVLVGHSLGGLIVRAYTTTYPEDVVGMVLVESSHEDNEIMMNGKVSLLRDFSRSRPIPAVQHRVTSLPEKKASEAAAAIKIEAPYDALPIDIQNIRRWAMKQPNYAAARSSEFDYLPEELVQMAAERVRVPVPLGHIPLVVVSRQDAPEPLNRLHGDLARLSINGRRVIAHTTDHHVQIEDPQTVISSVRDVVEIARSNAQRQSDKH
jgi:pimeloyl-ACP methyl ester carboxylesterase